MFVFNYNKLLKNRENYIKKNDSNEINDNKIQDKNEIKLKQIENIKKQKNFKKRIINIVKIYIIKQVIKKYILLFL